MSLFAVQYMPLCGFEGRWLHELLANWAGLV